MPIDRTKIVTRSTSDAGAGLLSGDHNAVRDALFLLDDEATANATALSSKLDADEVGGPNGVAPLVEGKVPTVNLPPFLGFPLVHEGTGNSTPDVDLTHTIGDEASLPGGIGGPFAPNIRRFKFLVTTAKTQKQDQLLDTGDTVTRTYGSATVDAIGTTHGRTLTFDVLGSADAGSETASCMWWQRAGNSSKPNVRIRQWGSDHSMHGPIGFQAGALWMHTAFLGNYYDGSPRDGLSHVYAAITRPGTGGGSEAGHGAATSYPVDLGFVATGVSSNSNLGFKIGFKTGGPASGWFNQPDLRGRIGTGFHAEDCQNWGVRATNAQAPNGLRIGWEEDAYLTRAGTGLIATPAEVEVTDPTKGVILRSPDGTRYRLRVANGGALSAVAVGGGYPTITDSFNRADTASGLGNVDAPSGMAWQTTAYRIVGNQAGAVVGSNHPTAYLPNTAPNFTYAVSIQLNQLESYPGLIFRYADDNNFAYLRFESNIYLVLRQVVNGVESDPLTNINGGYVNGQPKRITITLSGTSITYGDGSQTTSATLSAALTGTKVGIFEQAGNVTGTNRFEDVSLVPA